MSDSAAAMSHRTDTEQGREWTKIVTYPAKGTGRVFAGRCDRGHEVRDDRWVQWSSKEWNREIALT